MDFFVQFAHKLHFYLFSLFFAFLFLHTFAKPIKISLSINRLKWIAYFIIMKLEGLEAWDYFIETESLIFAKLPM